MRSRSATLSCGHISSAWSAWKSRVARGVSFTPIWRAAPGQEEMERGPVHRSPRRDLASDFIKYGLEMTSGDALVVHGEGSSCSA
eukprot:1481682-Lingulodinium_polyedra.AAC.1